MTLLRSLLYQLEFNSNGSRKMSCKCSPAGSRTICLGSRANRSNPTTTVRSSGWQTQRVQADTLIEVQHLTRNCSSRKFRLRIFSTNIITMHAPSLLDCQLQRLTVFQHAHHFHTPGCPRLLWGPCNAFTLAKFLFGVSLLLWH